MIDCRTARLVLLSLAALVAGCVRAPAPQVVSTAEPVEAAEGSAAPSGQPQVVIPPPSPAPPPLMEVRRPYDPLASVRSPADLALAPLAWLEALPAGIARSGGARGTLHLTVEGCRMLEPEPVAPVRGDDATSCRRSVREDFEQRGQRVLVVPAGAWEIVVDNARAERDAGLWLRRAGAPDQTLVSAGGIPPGHADRYEVELTSGQWLYSCPITPTPDYLLVVP